MTPTNTQPSAGAPTAYPSRYVIKVNLTPEELEKLKKMLLDHSESLEMLAEDEVKKI